MLEQKWISMFAVSQNYEVITVMVVSFEKE